MTREQKTRFLIEDFVRRLASVGRLTPQAEVFSALAETFHEILSTWLPQLDAGEATDPDVAPEAVFDLHRFLQDLGAYPDEVETEGR